VHATPQEKKEKKAAVEKLEYTNTTVPGEKKGA
jgi:hypothetical protein